MRISHRVPNFRNFGINLRILLIVNLITVIAAILQTDDWVAFMSNLANSAAAIQPVLLLTLALCYVLYPVLTKLTYAYAIVCIFVLVLVLSYGVHGVSSWLFEGTPSLGRFLLLASIMTAITLFYFNLHSRAYSPAITEARLQALQARIRPHFLFNSINAVLSLIRSQPKRAETALEDMADLFRVLMADNSDLVPLEREISLCKQYLALEKLRMDDRLNIDWQIDDMPADALIPPLLLQPLLENAVYHGIEPLEQGGVVTIRIETRKDMVHILINNPYYPQNDHHIGNKIALKNIKERLTLHFDLEASLKTSTEDHVYQVHIVIPYYEERKQ